MANRTNRSYPGPGILSQTVDPDLFKRVGKMYGEQVVHDYLITLHYYARSNGDLPRDILMADTDWSKERIHKMKEANLIKITKARNPKIHILDHVAEDRITQWITKARKIATAKPTPRAKTANSRVDMSRVEKSRVDRSRVEKSRANNKPNTTAADAATSTHRLGEQSTFKEWTDYLLACNPHADRQKLGECINDVYWRKNLNNTRLRLHVAREEYGMNIQPPSQTQQS